MNHQWTKTKRATKILNEGEYTKCRYHYTDVVKWNQKEMILESDGYETLTTKNRMNEVSSHYYLSFNVFQHKGQWFVSYRDCIIPFEDGMILYRIDAYGDAYLAASKVINSCISNKQEE